MPPCYTPPCPPERLPDCAAWSFYLHCRPRNAPAGTYYLLVPASGPQAGKVLAFDRQAECYNERIALCAADIAAAKWNAPYLHRCARRGIGWPFVSYDWPFVIAPESPLDNSAVPHPKQALGTPPCTPAAS